MTITHTYKSPNAKTNDSFMICWSSKSKEGEILSVDVSFSIKCVTTSANEYQKRVNALVRDFNNKYAGTEVPCLFLHSDVATWYIESWPIIQKINEENARKRADSLKE